MNKTIHLNERAEQCYKKLMGYRAAIANVGTGLDQMTMKSLATALEEFKSLWSGLGIVEQTDIKLLAIRELMYMNHCGFNAAAAEFDTYISGANTYI